jgi:hypothetical protein
MTMSTFARRAVAAVLALALALPLPATVLAQAPPAADAAGVPAHLAWPRRFEDKGTVLLVYQPQPDRWVGNQLDARAAFSVQPAGIPQPAFGVMWITARTEVDKVAGLVHLEDLKVARVSLPAAPDKSDAVLRAIRQHLPRGGRTVSLAELEASVAVAQAAPQTAAVPVKNDPPRIIVVATPALLVRVDGTPVLRQVAGSALLRVINTRALILLDPATARYYLAAGSRWLESAALDGAWTPVAVPPAAIDTARQAAVASGQVDLLEAAAPAGAAGPPPAIYVSTGPAELIVTQGPPEWSPIEGTDLLYVRNTEANVLMELRSQATYVLISGRWFRAQSTSGPWQYVPPAQLPPSFAQIPPHGPKAAVLTAVPGTPQAQEALIANSIPQTATINRSQARVAVVYDGAPQFRPIEGTPLQYAVNSPTPVIRVDARTYYALADGVWFVAASPAGPFAVAVVVPPVLYSIPPTSPLHYVTYVRVYGYTPTVVYVGYTPGYLGTVVGPDGVVVYGTGVVYTPWVGTVWYPPPATYGSSSGFSGAAAAGFMMGTMTGMAIGAATWGSCCYTTTSANVNVNRTVNTYNTTVNGSNVYNTWGSKTVVSKGSDSATVYRSPSSAVVTNNQNNNVYASHDGNVYRQDDGSYQKWDSSSQSWQQVQNPRTTSSSSSPSSVSSTAPSSSTPSSTSPPSRAQQRSTSGSEGAGTSSGSSSSSLSSPSTGQSSAEARAQQRAPQGGTGSGTAGASGSQRGTGESLPPRSEGAGGLGASSWGAGGQHAGSPAAGSGSSWLDRESGARQRGFERFSGGAAMGGFGGFRRR